MATLKEIKTRIGAVKSTQKITKAMKVVASTRLQKFEASLKDEIEGAGILEEAFRQLSYYRSELSHPLLIDNGVEKACVILISSDRGLCGAFNSSLFRTMKTFQETDLKEVVTEYIAIGHKAEIYFKQNDITPVRHDAKMSHDEELNCLAEVIKMVVDQYINKEIGRVYICYNEYKSRSKTGPVVDPLLPFSELTVLKKPEKREGSLYLVEPSIESCLSYLIPLYLKTLLHNAVLQSHTAEELSRMMAMDYATENANELTEKLTLLYNRTRQEVITTELSEIVGGAEALK